MFRAVYNLLLLVLTTLSFPKYLWEMVRHKKHRSSFLQKLGFFLPTFVLPKAGPRVWIHSISVGETKAIAPLVEQLEKQFPDLNLVVSTTTETGQAEAKRLMPMVLHHFYLPLDFSWIIRRLVKTIKPDLLILVESDLWYNLISCNPNVVLVNGKLSKTSFKRFRLFPFFTKRLLAPIQQFCVQSDRYRERFEALGVTPSKIVVTGNLKFDQLFPPIDRLDWKQKLAIKESDIVITVASTHDPEEEQLLDILREIPHLKILLAPRHPERFESVAQLLTKKAIPYARFSAESPADSQVVLIDQMGVVSSCYQLSHLAIVGGSFVSHVGGHNIFEPAALGVPVLFGPHMASQQDLVDLVVGAGAGKQLTLNELSSTVQQLINTSLTPMQQAGIQLATEVVGATDRTCRVIRNYLIEKHL